MATRKYSEEQPPPLTFTVDSGQTDNDTKENVASPSFKDRQNKKRIYPGMKLKDCYNWKPTPISEKETIFAVSEYISEIIRDDYTNIEKIIDLPKDLNNGKLVFQLETMRNFLIEVGFFVVHLSSECNMTNCPKMEATSKFRYRCSAHRKPKDCNAIQYCVHTLDLFTEKLNNKDYRMFKMSNTKNPNIEKRLKKDLSDLCRRVYRIFAHAFYHHESLFDDYEGSHLLCTRFIMFFRKYGLVQSQHFSREIQLPSNKLYFNRNQRKKRLREYFDKKKEMQQQQHHELQAAYSNSNVAELESDEVY